MVSECDRPLQNVDFTEIQIGLDQLSINYSANAEWLLSLMSSLGAPGSIPESECV